MRQFCLLVLLTCVTISLLCGAAEAKTRVEVTHVVQQGEDLNSIALLYITPDRELREFKEGIVERNYDKVFADRKPAYVIAGDILEIGFWKE